MNKSLLFAIVAVAFVAAQISKAQDEDGHSLPVYKSELNIAYCTVAGKELKMNAFLPEHATNPVPAIVDFHGGWWYYGDMASRVEDVGGYQLFAQHKLAIFSIQYCLGRDGGFPECIRDCRDAIRFIRKNARRFNIDPNRIDAAGESSGGQLSLMVAMVPEDFDDGGPTPGLEGVSAKVSGSFSCIQVTDFVRFWDQGPNDVVSNTAGKITFRNPDPDFKIPNDSRPYLRVLFHGITPDTVAHKLLYTNMCPIGYVRKDVPPLLICDGEKDPVVPGLEGKELYERLKVVGADATYWMTPNGGHDFPGGKGFWKDLDDFIVGTLKFDDSTNNVSSE